MVIKEAAVPLYPYQERWINDQSRFKLWTKSRQIGASFAAALEIVLDCASHMTKWIVLSTGERAAKEFVYDKVKPHTEALGMATEFMEIPARFADTEVLTLTVTFPNGSRIIALPANPDTARGYTGNVLLDEFAFHRDARKIWKAVFPTITRKGLKLRVVSTYNGKNNMYYELASAQGPNVKWSIHKTDIYQAAAEGMPVDIEELRAGVNDSDTWVEEYECEALDDAEQFISQEMITNCESELASLDFPPDFTPREDCYLGLDIGRKRDLTVFVVIETVGDVSVVRLLKRLPRTKFSAQRQELEDLLDLPWIRRACIDATGMGAQLAEEAADKYGESRVEGIEFNLFNKEMMAVNLKRKFEDRLIRIPADRDLRSAIKAVKRYSSSTGHFRFDADRTDKGHADEFWALALAEQAATQPSSFIGAGIAGAEVRP